MIVITGRLYIINNPPIPYFDKQSRSTSIEVNNVDSADSVGVYVQNLWVMERYKSGNIR